MNTRSKKWGGSFLLHYKSHFSSSRQLHGNSAFIWGKNIKGIPFQGKVSEGGAFELFFRQQRDIEETLALGRRQGLRALQPFVSGGHPFLVHHIEIHRFSY